MTKSWGSSGRSRGAILDWLVRVNAQVSQWAASMSWWRLILLFVVILVAGSIIGETLGLKHERVREVRSGRDTVISIGGKDGIRITKTPRGAKDAVPAPPLPPRVGAPPEAPGGGDEAAAQTQEKAAEQAIEDAAQSVEKALSKALGDEEVVVRRQVVTFRGIVGDLGAAAMVILFAYLVASKIIVKKVAQADAKVRTAQDTAERETMERQLAQARLQVLQAQVEPHFLFNTLATVDYLIETDPPRASKMQKALITYLRGALPQMRQQSSTLGRELRLVTSYLDLIKMRIEERLEVEIAVPEALRSAEFPPMMLQTLVENAIKHGIEPKPDGGKVRVAASLQNGQIAVEVSDTGVGLPDGELLDGPTSGTGVGLQNIRDRLAMLYPGRSTLMLHSGAAGGTLVRITLPHRVATEPAAQGMPPEGKLA
ncbi:sensor histidine kinase [Ramlibacter sp. RBP-2]|uniref:histidine kinase n=1 Tax=Ramlibacter lithotrophicus TaxID=2606681 RepID=A0A7X6DC97_9BURK|nr:sensor histidine kinase [Ramlibacter lithotrophicus]NKE64530.1 sensor histidine kinase [Ramlibacter lithotrophicus]